MKKFTLVLMVAGICFASCKKQSTTPSTPPPTTTGTLTITVNSPTITSGQSVLLTATGATSYSWSTGATTSSIVVSPTVTTSYTVKGTQGSNTGTATSVVTVQSATTRDSIWVYVAIEAPTSIAFNYHYDSTNTRVLLNSHRIPNKVFNIVKDGNFGNSISFFYNFIKTVGVDQATPILMKRGDTLTVQIDSLYYSSNNPVRGGSILIGDNVKPYNTGVSTASAIIYSPANSGSTGPVGRPMGNAPANGNGGTTQPFYWYLGGQFTYKWIKP